MKITSRSLMTVSWLVSIAATLGSLYFSEIAHFPPCLLCWYQRIFMYPIVIVGFVGLYLKDKHLPLFILPMALLGASIAFFHNLLYYQIISESAAPCLAGISCTTRFIEWFGFITIPFLSLSAFLLIGFLSFLAFRQSPK